MEKGQTKGKAKETVASVFGALGKAENSLDKAVNTLYTHDESMFKSDSSFWKETDKSVVSKKVKKKRGKK